MKIGVVKETKDKEYRVALTPTGAAVLCEAGHQVVIQQDAGVGSGFCNQDYRAVGADIVSVNQAWDSEMVVKVKEPQENEYRYLQQQMVFTYFHLSGVKSALTNTLLDRGTTAIAYDTLRDDQGGLPLLAPMSAVAGNMSVAVGGYYLAKFRHGKGIQLGTVLGESHGKVVVLGSGIVGQHAARTAAGMGARVYLTARNPEKGRQLCQSIPGDISFFDASSNNIAEQLLDADLLIGGVLVPGARAPHIVSQAMVKSMQRGSVIVDVSIDQGGCIETSRPTSHSDPVYEIHDVIHYCVTNMPGAYPRTSTLALTRATLPYIQLLAEQGFKAFAQDGTLATAINTYGGHIYCQAVAEDMGMQDRYRALTELL